MKGIFWFELLGIFWVNAFKVAAAQYIIAYAAGVWYFTHKSVEGVVSPVWKGVKTLFQYHIGSIAFGSFIVGSTFLLAILLKFVTEAAKRGKNNPVTKILCLCCMCCIGCVERFVSFLDDGVYIRIALSGESFCNSAKASFELIIENAGKFAVLAGVTGYFTIIGQIVISFVSTYVGYVILRHSDVYDSLKSTTPTMIAFLIVSYVIAGIFLSVYEIACDTIIQAYIIDSKQNKEIDLSAPQPMIEFMRDYKDEPDQGCC